MRARAVALSLVVHAVLLALIAQVRRRAAEREEAVDVELAEAPAAETADESPVADHPPAVEELAEDATRAAAEARPESPGPARREPAPPGRARPEPAAPAEGTEDEQDTGGATGEEAEEGLGLGWSLGSLGSGGGGGGGGAGLGGGGGGGGARATAAAAPAHRVSKARPPRLVYPKRVRDERDGEVFVAVVTIDEGGWVVGVRLVQGVSPYADQKALDAAWRLHYDPALDDSGRPIRARVKQRFMVE